MRIWLALLVAPALALIDQSLAYAVVGWSCAQQVVAPVHAVHALFLAAAVAATLGARGAWRDTPLADPGHPDGLQRRFLARIAMAVAALSALAIVAMWIPTWLISPCTA